LLKKGSENTTFSVVEDKCVKRIVFQRSQSSFVLRTGIDYYTVRLHKQMFSNRENIATKTANILDYSTTVYFEILGVSRPSSFVYPVHHINVVPVTSRSQPFNFFRLLLLKLEGAVI